MKGAAMRNATREFFDQIADQRFDARLGQAKGTLGFDVEGKHPEHFHVVLDRGAITVSQETGDADVTVATDQATFDGIVEGRINATTAALRGLVHVHGDVDLLFYFQRLFPAPARGAEAAEMGGVR
jgi:putative sterol carrier protein